MMVRREKETIVAACLEASQSSDAMMRQKQNNGHLGSMLLQITQHTRTLDNMAILFARMDRSQSMRREE